MRRARITYQGAFHHALNRGDDGRSLFQATVQTRMRKIVGEKSFIEKAIEKFNRRKTPEYKLESKRIDDLHFISVQQVYQEFRQIQGKKANEMDTTSFKGKRLRAGLLVHLKDRAGLAYSEIVKLPEFSDVKLFSLGAIYRNAKIRMGKRQWKFTTLQAPDVGCRQNTTSTPNNIREALFGCQLDSERTTGHSSTLLLFDLMIYLFFKRFCFPV